MPPNTSGEIAGQPSNLANAKVGPTDFNLLRVVGQGAFGKVEDAAYYLSSCSLFTQLATCSRCLSPAKCVFIIGLPGAKERYWSNLCHEDHAQGKDSCQGSWRICTSRTKCVDSSISPIHCHLEMLLSGEGLVLLLQGVRCVPIQLKS